MATFGREITVINVPSDIGSMIKGKHLAPSAIQTAKLVPKLQNAGYTVTESSALSTPQIWSPEASFEPNGVRNEEANVQVNHDVKAAVSSALRKIPHSSSAPAFQIVVGGECNILPAILSAYWTVLAPKRVGLIYVDGDADLVVPGEAGSSGNLASMTFTHLTLREGSLESMMPFSRPDGRGVCDPENAVLFGINAGLQGNTRGQLGYLFDEGYRVFTSASVAKDPEGRAMQALNWLQERVDWIFVHLDVDAIDASTFPLANVPNRTGAGFEKIMAALNVFLGSEKVVGLSIAEVNPDHDPGLKMTARLVDGLVGALGERLKKA